MERLKEIFSGESISCEEFFERLKARPDIAGEYVSAAELEKANARLAAEKAAREKDTADFAAELSAARRDMMMDLALSRSGAKSIKAARALINEQAVTLDNGELLGMEQEIERVGKDCPYLFSGAARGVNPPAPSGGAAAAAPDESARWREEAGLPAK